MVSTTVETYPGGLPIGNIKYKTSTIPNRSVTSNVSEALKQISNFPFTITDATSTEAEDKVLKRTSPTHLQGRAIDVRFDEEGHNLVNWITQTPDGNSWAKKFGVSILPHGEGTNVHYHIQFSK